MKLEKVNENLQVWFPTKPTRDRSFIADIDLAEHCPEFWHKCYDVLSGCYTFKSKSIVKSIMEFYDDWSYITWKQYDLILGMYKSSDEYNLNNNANYYRSRMHTLSNAGWLAGYITDTFNDHILPHLSDEDLMGRYLPTDEELEDLWLNVATSVYSDLYTSLTLALS